MPKMTPRDLGLLEDDMGSIEDKRGGLRRPVGGPPPRGMAGAMAAKRPMANPADANIFTADKGIQPPSPDEGPTMTAPRGMRRPGMKKGGCVKKMASGGSTGSASKRADGIATKGKTKGKII